MGVPDPGAVAVQLGAVPRRERAQLLQDLERVHGAAAAVVGLLDRHGGRSGPSPSPAGRSSAATASAVSSPPGTVRDWMPPCCAALPCS